MTFEIYYVHSKRNTRSVSAGHWFYHTGQDAQCAFAEQRADGRWLVHLNFEVWNKPLPNTTLDFESIAEVKDFIQDYFEKPLVEVSPRHFAQLLVGK